MLLIYLSLEEIYSEYGSRGKIIENKPQKVRKTKPFPLAVLASSQF